MMAVTIRVHTVLDALVACGVDNKILINGQTPAWRISDEIFGDDFESYMDRTTKELENYFKSFSKLTQAQDQIELFVRLQKENEGICTMN